MPRYFFNLRDGVEVIADPEGRELPDAEAIGAEARRAALAIVSEPDGRRGADERAFDIADESGQRIATLPFADLIEPSRHTTRSVAT